jgi:hypothetical protein
VSAEALTSTIKTQHAATLSHGPFLTFTVSESGGKPAQIGSELAAPSGSVIVNYKLSAPPWVSVDHLQIYVNGLISQIIRVDPDRNLADRGGQPLTGMVTLTLTKDSWIVMEAVGGRPMFPVVTGTEEPFLLISDAVGALAGPLGIAASTDISVVVVGNEAPHALTNPIWVRLSSGTWQAPGVAPFAKINDPTQDPHVGVLLTHN